MDRFVILTIFYSDKALTSLCLIRYAKLEKVGQSIINALDHEIYSNTMYR